MEAERLVTEMRGQGLTPDKYTYSSLMSAYGNSVRARYCIVSYTRYFHMLYV